MKKIILAILIIMPLLAHAQLVKIVSKQSDYITDRATYSTFSKDSKYLYTSSFNGGIGVFKVNSDSYIEKQVLPSKKINTPYINGVTQVPLHMEVTENGEFLFVANRTASANYEWYGDGVDIYKRNISTGEITLIQKHLTWEDGYEGLEKIQKFQLSKYHDLLITINLISGIGTYSFNRNNGELTQINLYDLNTPGFEDFRGPWDIVELPNQRLVVLNPLNNYIHLLKYSADGAITILDKISTKSSADLETPMHIAHSQTENRFLLLAKSGVGTLKVESDTLTIDKTSWDGTTYNLLASAGLAYNSMNNSYIGMSKDTGELIKFSNKEQGNKVLSTAFLTMTERSVLDPSSIISSNPMGNKISITGQKQGVVALVKNHMEAIEEHSIVGHDNNEISKIRGVRYLEPLGGNELLAYSGERTFTKFHFDQDDMLLKQDFYVFMEETAPITTNSVLNGIAISPDKNFLYSTYAGSTRDDSGVNTYAIDTKSGEIKRIDYVSGESLNINNFSHADILGDNSMVSISADGKYVYFSNGQYDLDKGVHHETLEIFSITPSNGFITFEGRYIDGINEFCNILRGSTISDKDTITHTKDNKFIYSIGNNTVSILKKEEDGHLSCIQSTTRSGQPAAPNSLALLAEDRYLLIAEPRGIRLFSRNSTTGLLIEKDHWSLSDEQETLNGRLDNVTKIIKHPFGNRFFALAQDTSQNQIAPYLGYFKVNNNTDRIELLDTLHDFYDESEDTKSVFLRDWEFSSDGEYLHLIDRTSDAIWNIEVLEKAPTEIESITFSASDNQDDSIHLLWSKVNMATNYQLYVSETNEQDFTLLQKVEDNEYTHTNIGVSKIKYYRLKACNDMGCTEPSKQVKGKSLDNTNEEDQESDNNSNNSSSGGGNISLLLLLIISFTYYVKRQTNLLS